MRQGGIGTVLLFVSVAGLAAAQTQSGVQIAGASALDRVREALGEPLVGVVTIEGRATFLGEEGRYQSAFDGSGRFRSRLESALGVAGGYDGTTAWEVDWNGMPRVQELGDDDTALLEAWAISGHWAREPDRVELQPLEPDDAGPRFKLTMADGKLEAVVHIDEDSSLPAQFVIDRPDGDATISLSDYTRHEGISLPTRVEVSSPTGERTLVHFTGFASKPADPRLFAPNLAPPGDARFDAALPAEVEVMRVPTGHLLVHPLVNGQDVGWFIFDTGAGSNVLSTTAAETLGLPSIGHVRAQGVGGSIESAFFRVEELTLGPLTLAGQKFVGIDLAFLKPHFGVDVAGIVGYDMLSRCIVEFDGADKPSIAIFDPARYPAPEAVRWEPLMLPGRIPAVVCEFEGREAAFKLDTGAAGDTVSFHAPAVEEFGLLEGRETTPAMAGGVGGMVEMRAGTIRTFTLGGHTWEELPAQFAKEKVGAFADPFTAGNVGGVVLGRFQLVLDYPERRIGFIERE